MSLIIDLVHSLLLKISCMEDFSLHGVLCLNIHWIVFTNIFLFLESVCKLSRTELLLEQSLIISRLLLNKTMLGVVHFFLFLFLVVVVEITKVILANQVEVIKVFVLKVVLILHLG